MPDDKKYFIDTHCHFFSISDIPILNIVERVNLNKYRVVAIAAAIFATVWPEDLNEKVRKHFGSFISFMEDEPGNNIIKVMKQINTACKHVEGYDDRLRILTPLVMDFELSRHCEHKKLKRQFGRLMEGISLADKKPVAGDFKVLPFIGLSMKRFDGGKTFGNVINNIVGPIKDYNQRKDIDGLESGDVIGIKLYSSLGSNPYPGGALRAKYMKVYKEIEALRLPITVHCQKVGHMSGGESRKTLLSYTNPKNWLEILKSTRKLKINLAHFGGEEGVKNTVLWEEEEDDDIFPNDNIIKEINTRSWTFTIIQILKKYPNAYADISAFDFSDKKAVASLAWILSLDCNGKKPFDFGSYKLVDKLMWGSDYPMMLLGPDYRTGYRELFKAFSSAMDIKNLKIGMYKKPPGRNVPDRDALIEKLINTNPKKFLF